MAYGRDGDARGTRAWSVCASGDGPVSTCAEGLSLGDYRRLKN